MKANFNSLIKSDIPVLVDFHATWCAPCKAQAPILKELAQEMGDKVKILKIDVDKNPKVAAQYRIQGVPTLAIFKNGNLLWRQSGVQDKQKLKSVVLNYQNH